MIINLILKHEGKKSVFVWNEVFLNLRKSIIIPRAIMTWVRNEWSKRGEGAKGGIYQALREKWTRIDVQLELNWQLKCLLGITDKGQGEQSYDSEL